jgi:N utilization substance protein A
MKDTFAFLDALQQIAKDKGISVDTLLDALANALVAAYKRLPNAAEEAVVTIDPDTGDIRVYGQELDEDGNVVREWDDTPKDFGRIAAQTAKQVMTQRIREAERDLKYEEYAGREGDIVTGIIQQSDNRYTLLDLGKVEALLPQAEQVPYERYEHGARLKAYIVEVRKTTKGPQIVVSRTHPGLIKRLFELEVPEISSGVVEIKAAAREPGHRTKIAVWSNDANVDPVGACVGARGARVRMVTNELRGEKVDIVPFSDDPREFVMRALQPAKVKEVHLDDLSGTATVVVHDFQLSLAIGKEGQNARLAARLTGWRIDIKSETQIAEEEAYANQEWAEGEWVENEAGEMVWQPAEGGESVSAEQWSMAEASETPDADGDQADAGQGAATAAGPGRRGPIAVPVPGAGGQAGGEAGGQSGAGQDTVEQDAVGQDASGQDTGGQDASGQSGSRANAEEPGAPANAEEPGAPAEVAPSAGEEASP